MVSDLTFYQFSRDRVERGDFPHFLGVYGTDSLPHGRELAAMMNRLVLAVDGYNDDPREVYLIREVRRFFASLNQEWPYLLYFANLDTENFQTVVLCLLPSIATIKRDGSAVAGVEYDRLELVQWLAAGFAPMNGMCERAGLSEQAIFERTKALFEYFELPFDVQPPE